MSLLSDLWQTLAGMAWLEFIGLISGLLCVWLLIRQNVWTFPIGLVYSVVSVVVFIEARLYADVLLSGYYVLMNAYGWYYWLYGGVRTAADELLVTHTPPRTGWLLAVLTVAAIAGMGWFFDTRTDADFPYWDSATTCMSFAAMWMTARKYIENWMVWLVGGRDRHGHLLRERHPFLRHPLWGISRHGNHGMAGMATDDDPAIGSGGTSPAGSSA